ncbi:MAG: hypothetical protein AAGJ46_09145 [Planctomycetota bacterium]
MFAKQAPTNPGRHAHVSGWGTFVALTVALSCLGCGGERESFQDQVARCAQLSGAKASKLEGLRTEVARIESVGETPLALSSPAISQAEQDGSNAALMLRAALNDATRLQLLPKLDDCLPEGRFVFKPKQIERARSLLDGVQRLRGAIAAAEQAPRCEFQTRTDLGFFAKLRYLDDAAIATRLHVLAAGTRLADGELPAAINELRLALWWADHLGRTPRLEARLLAAQLRGQCLVVIEAIVGGELVGVAAPQKVDVERLYTLLRQSLDDWPGDDAPLVGDRAVTLHAYEALREGMYKTLVTKEEKAMLDRRGLLGRVADPKPRELDADQLAYLEVMAGLIEAAAEPHYKRADQVKNLLGRVAPDTDGASRAPLAAYLFLPGAGDALEEMARDRAACEAWAVALASVGGLDRPPYRVNPVTGEDYELVRSRSGVEVRTGDSRLRDPFAEDLP